MEEMCDGSSDDESATDDNVSLISAEEEELYRIIRNGAKSRDVMSDEEYKTHVKYKEDLMLLRAKTVSNFLRHKLPVLVNNFTSEEAFQLEELKVCHMTDTYCLHFNVIIYFDPKVGESTLTYVVNADGSSECLTSFYTDHSKLIYERIMECMHECEYLWPNAARTDGLFRSIKVRSSQSGNTLLQVTFTIPTCEEDIALNFFSKLGTHIKYFLLHSKGTDCKVASLTLKVKYKCGSKSEHLFGEAQPIEMVDGMKFIVNGMNYCCWDPVCIMELSTSIVELAGLNNTWTTLQIGHISAAPSLFLARVCKSVFMLTDEKSDIGEYITQTAQMNNINNFNYKCGPMRRILHEALEGELYLHDHICAVIFDSCCFGDFEDPRCSELLINNCNIKKIICVSCSREYCDIRKLVTLCCENKQKLEKSFIITRASSVDISPYDSNIQMVYLLERLTDVNKAISNKDILSSTDSPETVVISSDEESSPDCVIISNTDDVLRKDRFESNEVSAKFEVNIGNNSLNLAVIPDVTADNIEKKLLVKNSVTSGSKEMHKRINTVCSIASPVSPLILENKPNETDGSPTFEDIRTLVINIFCKIYSNISNVEEKEKLECKNDDKSKDKVSTPATLKPRKLCKLLQIAEKWSINNEGIENSKKQHPFNDFHKSLKLNVRNNRNRTTNNKCHRNVNVAGEETMQGSLDLKTNGTLHISPYKNSNVKNVDKTIKKDVQLDLKENDKDSKNIKENLDQILDINGRSGIHQNLRCDETCDAGVQKDLSENLNAEQAYEETNVNTYVEKNIQGNSSVVNKNGNISEEFKTTDHLELRLDTNTETQRILKQHVASNSSTLTKKNVCINLKQNDEVNFMQDSHAGADKNLDANKQKGIETGLSTDSYQPVNMSYKTEKILKRNTNQTVVSKEFKEVLIRKSLRVKENLGKTSQKNVENMDLNFIKSSERASDKTSEVSPDEFWKQSLDESVNNTFENTETTYENNMHLEICGDFDMVDKLHENNNCLSNHNMSKDMPNINKELDINTKANLNDGIEKNLEMEVDKSKETGLTNLNIDYVSNNEEYCEDDLNRKTDTNTKINSDCDKEMIKKHANTTSNMCVKSNYTHNMNGHQTGNNDINDKNKQKRTSNINVDKSTEIISQVNFYENITEQFKSNMLKNKNVAQSITDCSAKIILQNSLSSKEDGNENLDKSNIQPCSMKSTKARSVVSHTKKIPTKKQKENTDLRETRKFKRSLRHNYKKVIYKKVKTKYDNVQHVTKPCVVQLERINLENMSTAMNVNIAQSEASKDNCEKEEITAEDKTCKIESLETIGEMEPKPVKIKNVSKSEVIKSVNNTDITKKPCKSKVDELKNTNKAKLVKFKLRSTKLVKNNKAEELIRKGIFESHTSSKLTAKVNNTKKTGKIQSTNTNKIVSKDKSSSVNKGEKSNRDSLKSVEVCVVSEECEGVTNTRENDYEKCPETNTISKTDVEKEKVGECKGLINKSCKRINKNSQPDNISVASDCKENKNLKINKQEDQTNRNLDMAEDINKNTEDINKNTLSGENVLVATDVHQEQTTCEISGDISENISRPKETKVNMCDGTIPINMSHRGTTLESVEELQRQLTRQQVVFTYIKSFSDNVRTVLPNLVTFRSPELVCHLEDLIFSTANKFCNYFKFNLDLPFYYEENSVNLANILKLGHVDTTGSYTEVNSIPPGVMICVYQKIIAFIEETKKDCYDSLLITGSWKAFSVSITATEKIQLYIEIVIPVSPQTADKFLTGLEQMLIFYFINGHEPALEVEFVILNIYHGNECKTMALYGFKCLSGTGDKLIIKLHQPFNLRGMTDIVNVIMNNITIDSSWGIIQVGCGYDLPTVCIAKLCKRMYVLNADAVTAKHLYLTAQQNSIHNLRILDDDHIRHIKNFNKYYMKNCYRNVCIIAYGVFPHSSTSEISALKDYLNVSTVIIMVEQPLDNSAERKLVALCQPSQDPFVISKVIPVDMFPDDQKILFIYLLTRKSLLTGFVEQNKESTRKKRSKYLCQATKQTIQNISQPKNKTKKTCVSRASKPLATKKKSKPEILKNICKPASSDEVSQVIPSYVTSSVDTHRSGCINLAEHDPKALTWETSFNHVVLRIKDKLVNYFKSNHCPTLWYTWNELCRDPDAQNARSRVLSMMHEGGPKTVNDVELQVKWKQVCSLSDVLMVSNILKYTVPHYVNFHTPEFVFLVEDMRPCSVQETLCDKLQGRTEVSVAGVLPVMNGGRLSHKGSFIPVKWISSDPSRSLYEKIMRAVWESPHPLFDPIRKEGFWKEFAIRVNSYGQCFMHVTVNTALHEEGAVYLIPTIHNYLLNYLFHMEPINNVVSMMLTIHYRSGSITRVLFGEMYLPEMFDNFNIKVYEPFMWSNPYGMYTLCHTIEEFAHMDNTSAVVQIGCEYEVPPLYFSQKCQSFFLVCNDIVAVSRFESNAKDNGISNYYVCSDHPGNEELIKLFQDRLSEYEHVSAVVFDFCETRGDENILLLLKSTNINIIIFVMKTITPTLLKKLIMLCAADSNPFVVAKVTSVEMCPEDDEVAIIFLLVRKNLFAEFLESNVYFSEENLNKFKLIRNDDDSTILQDLLVKFSLQVMVGSEKSNDRDILSSGVQVSSTDIQETVCMETHADCSQKSTVVQSDSPVIRRCDVADTRDIGCDVNVKELVREVFNAYPKTLQEYQTHLKWKGELVFSEAKILSELLKPVVPLVVKDRNYGLMFYLKDIRPCPMTDTLSDLFEVHSDIDPLTHQPAMKYSSIFGGSIPAKQIRSDIIKTIHERMMVFINESNFPLFNPHINIGFWKSFVIRVNHVGEALLLAEGNTGSYEEAVEHMTKLGPLLKEHFECKENNNYNLASLVMRISYEKGAETEILFGENFITDKIGKFSIRLYGKCFSWSNPFGCRELGLAILGLADVDKSWIVIQIGIEQSLASFYLAKLCRNVFMMCKNETFGVRSVSCAGDNNIHNFSYYSGPVMQELEKFLISRSPNEKICVLLYDSSDMTDKNVLYLRENQCVKKIIIPYNFGDLEQVKRMFLLCQKDSIHDNPFVIRKCVSVDMSPNEDDVRIVFLLVRSSFISKSVEKNKEFSEANVGPFLQMKTMPERPNYVKAQSFVDLGTKLSACGSTTNFETQISNLKSNNFVDTISVPYSLANKVSASENQSSTCKDVANESLMSINTANLSSGVPIAASENFCEESVNSCADMTVEQRSRTLERYFKCLSKMNKSKQDINSSVKNVQNSVCKQDLYKIINLDEKTHDNEFNKEHVSSVQDGTDDGTHHLPSVFGNNAIFDNTEDTSISSDNSPMKGQNISNQLQPNCVENGARCGAALDLNADLEERKALFEKIVEALLQGLPKTLEDYGNLVEWKDEHALLESIYFSKILKFFLPYLVKFRTEGLIFLLENLKACPLPYTVCDTFQIYSGVNSSSGQIEMIFSSHKGDKSIKLEHVQSKIVADTFKKILDFMQGFQEEFFDPVKGAGFWQSVTIRLNHFEQMMVVIEGHISGHKRDARVTKKVSSLVSQLKDYFSNTTVFDQRLESCLLKINYRNCTEVNVLYGEKFLNYTVGAFNIKVYDSPIYWTNPCGAQQLSDAILELAGVNRTWGVLQLGSECDVPSFPLAMACKEMFVIDKSHIHGERMISNANNNNIVNIKFFHSGLLYNVLESELKCFEHTCIFVSSSSALKEYVDPAALYLNSNIKKIICIANLDDLADLKKIVVFCRKSTLVEPFIIVGVIPVDMSPYKNDVKMIYLLVRESFVSDRIEVNMDYSEEVVIKFLNLNDKNFEENGHAEALKMLLLAAQSNTKNENVDISTVNVDSCTKVQLQQWSTDPEEYDETWIVNLNDDVLYKQITTAVYSENIRNSGTLKKILHWKQKWVSLQAKYVSDSLNNVLPTVVKYRRTDLMFHLDNLITCPVTETLCDRFEVCAGTDPVTNEVALKYHLNPDRTLVPIENIRSSIVQFVLEKINVFIKMIGGLFNNKKESGLSSITISVNDGGHIILLVTVIYLTYKNQALVDDLGSKLRDLFNLNEDKYKLNSLVLKVQWKDSSQGFVLFGTGYLTYSVGQFRVLIRADSYPWSHSVGVLNLSSSIVIMANIDKSWAVLQMGCDCVLVSLQLAQVCEKIIVLEKSEQQGVNIVSSALLNDIQNLEYLYNKDIRHLLEDTLLTKLHSYTHVCLLLFDLDCFRDSALDQALLMRNQPSIRKIVYVSRFVDQLKVRQFFILCRRNALWEEPFVIVKAVPVDLSPHENNIRVVFFLVRESIILNTTEKNVRYSEVSAKNFIETENLSKYQTKGKDLKVDSDKQNTNQREEMVVAHSSTSHSQRRTRKSRFTDIDNSRGDRRIARDIQYERNMDKNNMMHKIQEGNKYYSRVWRNTAVLGDPGSVHANSYPLVQNYGTMEISATYNVKCFSHFENSIMYENDLRSRIKLARQDNERIKNFIPSYNDRKRRYNEELHENYSSKRKKRMSTGSYMAQNRSGN